MLLLIQNMMAFSDNFGPGLAPEIVKASLVLALIGSSVVIGLFGYVGRRTQRASYIFWAMGWMFYAVYLAAMIANGFVNEDWRLATIPTACVALSAWFMWCGGLATCDRPVSQPRPVERRRQWRRMAGVRCSRPAAGAGRTAGLERVLRVG